MKIKKKKLQKDLIDYIKYLLTDDDEYPFETWMMTESEEDLSEIENELADISYYARHMVEVAKTLM